MNTHRVRSPRRLLVVLVAALALTIVATACNPALDHIAIRYWNGYRIDVKTVHVSRWGRIDIAPSWDGCSNLSVSFENGPGFALTTGVYNGTVFATGPGDLTMTFAADGECDVDYQIRLTDAGSPAAIVGDVTVTDTPGL